MKKSFLAVLSLSLLLVGCAAQGQHDQSDYYFQLATPRHYDVWVEHLEFELSGERHWYHPAGTMNCCWRGPHGPRGITGRLEPFPNYIAIQWFSLAEEKYYQRLISIPPEWKERMRELAPIQTAGGLIYKPRDFLVFGLAPGGEIVVWIKSQIGNEVELARFKANQIEGDPQEYSKLMESYQLEHGEYLKKHGIPLEGW